MKRKVRMIFTTAYQDGPEHWSQEYQTIDSEIELPDKIFGVKTEKISGDSNIGFVGLEWLGD